MKGDNHTTMRYVRRAACLAVTVVMIGGCGSSGDGGDGDGGGERAPAGGTEDTTLERALDFAPFDTALGELEAAHSTTHDALTRGGDVVELRAALDAGELTARELTLFYLSRIRRLDAALDSVIELNPAALAEADRLDARRADGQSLGRLHGIPILLKDNIATGDGLHNTAGAAALAEHRPPRDAFVIARLREAGAIVLGKANLSEWAFYLSTRAPSGYSALGGQVVNPFGRDLEVLGSSTGSAVAASARLAAATLGTETTGSIIAPAAANGVAGMRPTLGLVSGDLIIPISTALDSAGPIGRHVTDLAALLSVMAERDDADANVALAGGVHGTDFLAALGSRTLAGLVVGIPDIAGTGADAVQRASFENAIAILEAGGATVMSVPVDPASVAALADGQGRLLRGSFAPDLAAYLDAADAPVGSLAEVIAFNEADPSRRVPFGQDLLEGARDDPLAPADRAALVESFRATALSAIENAANAASVDVLLSLDNTFSLYYAAAGTPAVTVPIGLDARGQPHGATFVGTSRGSDADVLAIAHAFEQAARLRVDPSDRLDP